MSLRKKKMNVSKDGNLLNEPTLQLVKGNVFQMSLQSAFVPSFGWQIPPGQICLTLSVFTLL